MQLLDGHDAAAVGESKGGSLRGEECWEVRMHEKERLNVIKR